MKSRERGRGEMGNERGRLRRKRRLEWGERGQQKKNRVEEKEKRIEEEENDIIG